MLMASIAIPHFKLFVGRRNYFNVEDIK
jgi:hypothetical protein